MISICVKVRLQQLRKTKYSILATILHIFLFFFFLQNLIPTCTIHCINLVIFLYFDLNLEAFFRKCDFSEKFVSPFLFEQDLDLMNSVIIFLFQITLLRWLTFLLLLFWIYLFLLTLLFDPQWLSFHWEILIKFLSQFPLTYHQIHNGKPRFIA